MELSPTNISIDLLIAVLYTVAVWRGIVALYLNHLLLRNKIYIACFVALGCLYLFQTTIQLITGNTAIIWIWDIINGISVFLTLSIVTLLAKKLDTK